MVIEINDKNIENYLKNFSYKEIEKFVVSALKDKLEDIKDYNLLKNTRNEEKFDFEKLINENNS